MANFNSTADPLLMIQEAFGRNHEGDSRMEYGI